jgi:hypothetical protein
MRLTKKEKEVLVKIGYAHKAFIELEQQHPDDIRDYVNGVHIMQGLIMQRVARRASKEFPVYNKTKKGWIKV